MVSPLLDQEADLQLYGEQVGELEAVIAKIDLTVGAAKDLPVMDKNLLTEVGAQKGSSDPYVRIQFGTREWYTSVKNDTLYPQWEENFKLEAAAQVGCLQGMQEACLPCCATPQRSTTDSPGELRRLRIRWSRAGLSDPERGFCCDDGAG